MKVLIACEFSGVVRDAFIAHGHDAESCDSLPTERPNWTLDSSNIRNHHADRGHHHQGDLRRLLEETIGYWDLIIFHLPCTRFANSGVRWLYKDGRSNGEPLTEANREKERWLAMKADEELWHWCMNYSCPRMAFENPIPHGYVDLNPHRWPLQTIQPWMFGHGETKATNLYTKNLSFLKPTKVVTGRDHRVHHASPGENRWKERSRTLQGIADAMAKQWGSLTGAKHD